MDEEIDGAEPTNFEGETYIGMQVIFQAVEGQQRQAGRVAKALSGHEFDTILGKVTIRAEDHQLLKPNYFGVVEDVGGTLRPVIKTTVSASRCRASDHLQAHQLISRRWRPEIIPAARQSRSIPPRRFQPSSASGVARRPTSSAFGALAFPARARAYTPCAIDAKRKNANAR